MRSEKGHAYKTDLGGSGLGIGRQVPELSFGMGGNCGRTSQTSSMFRGVATHGDALVRDVGSDNWYSMLGSRRKWCGNMHDGVWQRQRPGKGGVKIEDMERQLWGA